jgi:HEAT repeat protein
MARRGAVSAETLLALVRTGERPADRAVALGALVETGPPGPALAGWSEAARDVAPAVRRRAAELAPRVARRRAADVLSLLHDPDPLVAEAAAWALGEVRWRSNRPAVVGALVETAGTHADPLVREAAVAALGSLGDEAGLPAVLAGCHDKPAVRRRAVIALSAFEGEEVEAALRAALSDRDWQVRQAAEDLSETSIR